MIEAAAIDASWSFPPVTVAALAGLIGAYSLRWRHVRAARSARDAPIWRLLTFGLGVAALAAALLSPLARLGEQMFVWHTIQHMLVLDAAPILMAAGCTRALLDPILGPTRPLVRAFGLLAHPAPAMLLYAGALWFWHISSLYELALTQPPIHAIQHVSLLLIGVVFWWHVFGPADLNHSVRGLGVFPYMGGAKLLTGILASLLLVAPWGFFVYDYYAAQPRMWGLTLGQDKELGAALLMTEELLLMTSAFGFMFVRMLTQAEREDVERETALLRSGASEAAERTPTHAPS